MQTKILKIDSLNLDEKIIIVAELIRKGELVAFPTETVYGLGADAFNPDAVKRIFVAKGRPADNPLIVHISSYEQLRWLVSEYGENASKLMKAFWPGPLTIIFKKNKKVPDIVTAGLNSVAVRMPSHPIALALIKESGSPIAAPSANLSGKPSPTKAEDVFHDLNGKIACIIDSGSSDIGLESTVIDCTQKIPVLLRPGAITREQIANAIGTIKIHDAVRNKIDAGTIEKMKIKSPGMKYRHYAPNARIIVVEGEKGKAENKINELIKIYSGRKIKVIEIADKNEGAREIYNIFRIADKDGIEIIVISGIDEAGIGMALMNRIRKAASEIIEV